MVGGGGPTSKKDKLNDNLLWSCCCARVDWTWTTVCGCYSGPNKCDRNCLEDALTEESLFYPVGIVSVLACPQRDPAQALHCAEFVQQYHLHVPQFHNLADGSAPPVCLRNSTF